MLTQYYIICIITNISAYCYLGVTKTRGVCSVAPTHAGIADLKPLTSAISQVKLRSAAKMSCWFLSKL